MLRNHGLLVRRKERNCMHASEARGCTHDVAVMMTKVHELKSYVSRFESQMKLVFISSCKMWTQ